MNSVIKFFIERKKLLLIPMPIFLMIAASILFIQVSKQATVIAETPCVIGEAYCDQSTWKFYSVVASDGKGGCFVQTQPCDSSDAGIVYGQPGLRQVRCVRGTCADLPAKGTSAAVTTASAGDSCVKVGDMSLGYIKKNDGCGGAMNKCEPGSTCRPGEWNECPAGTFDEASGFVIGQGICTPDESCQSPYKELGVIEVGQCKCLDNDDSADDNTLFCCEATGEKAIANPCINRTCDATANKCVDKGAADICDKLDEAIATALDCVNTANDQYGGSDEIDDLETALDKCKEELDKDGHTVDFERIEKMANYFDNKGGVMFNLGGGQEKQFSVGVKDIACWNDEMLECGKNFDDSNTSYGCGYIGSCRIMGWFASGNWNKECTGTEKCDPGDGVCRAASEVNSQTKYGRCIVGSSDKGDGLCRKFGQNFVCNPDNPDSFLQRSTGWANQAYDTATVYVWQVKNYISNDENGFCGPGCQADGTYTFQGNKKCAQNNVLQTCVDRKNGMADWDYEYCSQRGNGYTCDSQRLDCVAGQNQNPNPIQSGNLSISASGSCVAGGNGCSNGVSVNWQTNGPASCTITDNMGNTGNVQCQGPSNSGSASGQGSSMAPCSVCMYNAKGMGVGSSSGSNSSGTSSGSASGTYQQKSLTFNIKCDGAGGSSSTSQSCGAPSDPNNSYCPENPNNVENPNNPENPENPNNPDTKAPSITVVKPTGKVTSKSTEMLVTTNIKSTCKYMDSKEGSFSASNFDSAGMTMNDGDGYQHSVTLSSLGEGLTGCQASHSITVLCKNQGASQYSNNKNYNQANAIGSKQFSFTVNLSDNAEYAPVVTSEMDSEPQTKANPILKISTDKPADCQYKKGSDFKYGSGTNFENTGSQTHNTPLEGLNNNGGQPYVYYVVCKDKDTCATNTPGAQVKFKVNLEACVDCQPKITNTTPETQTVANPTLSVTTAADATCQYKENSTFKYDDAGATQFTNDGGTSHSTSIASLADGKHTFYVACKDKASGAVKTLEQPIVTTLSKTSGGMTITNTTPAEQNTSTPTVSITTVPSNVTCQYKVGSDFTYGGGMQFSSDAGPGHSVTLPTVADDVYTVFVVCKDPATGATNTPGAQIKFQVNTKSDTCAKLSTNDKVNDEDRDVSDDDDDDADSNYVWREIEAGTREKFNKVDWYAGYQFTPYENGTITHLCGYFGEGNNNKVSLYRYIGSTYREIASVTVNGASGWSCAKISKTKVDKDKRYYVIARVQDKPIYYEYKSRLLPKDSNDIKIEVGIRQLADKEFGTKIVKYDYMLLGLVDIRFNKKTTDGDDEGPSIEYTSPSGSISTSSTKLTVQTNEEATCKFSRSDVDYEDMKYQFGKTGTKNHEQKVCGLEEGDFTFYVRCKSKADSQENGESAEIEFEVE